ncbi:MAG: hypothetical protein J5517_04840 [Eubacterium sp.]|nr:hypothetical protein [Eubacterium sp.]
MKKRTKIIIIAAILLLAAVIIGIICIANYRSHLYLFKDTDYPVSMKWDEGALLVKVKDKTRSDIVWTAASDDPDFIVVEPKGKTGTKKASYILTPKSPGKVDVSFTKSVEAGSINVDKVKIVFHIYVKETLEGFDVSFSKEPELILGDEIIGSGTDHPVILRDNSSDGYYEEGMIYGNIFFMNGRGDWTISADNGDIEILDCDEEDGSFSYLFYSLEGASPQMLEEETTAGSDIPSASRGDAVITADSAQDKKEALLTLSSQSLNITVTYNVSFYSDGHMEFNRVDK